VLSAVLISGLTAGFLAKANFGILTDVFFCGTAVAVRKGADEFCEATTGRVTGDCAPISSSAV
jgi:hypothetical protein